MNVPAERSFTGGLVWFLGAAIALGGAAAYVIQPLQRAAAEQAHVLSEKSLALARARIAVHHVRELEPAAAEARGRLNEIISNLGPDPATTVPGLIKEHFRHAGFDATVESLNVADEIPAMPGYARRRLRIQIALRDEADKIAVLLEAAAALEQRTPLIRLAKFELQSLPAGPLERSATLDFSILLPK